MMLPARYGRFWTITAACVVFLVVLATLRTIPPSNNARLPDPKLDEQRKAHWGQDGVWKPFSSQPLFPKTSEAFGFRSKSPTSTLVNTPSIPTSAGHGDEAEAGRSEFLSSPGLAENPARPIVAHAEDVVETGHQPAELSSPMEYDDVGATIPHAAIPDQPPVQAPPPTPQEEDDKSPTADAGYTGGYGTHFDENSVPPEGSLPPKSPLDEKIDAALDISGIVPEAGSDSTNPFHHAAPLDDRVVAAEDDTSAATSTSTSPEPTSTSKIAVMGRLESEDTNWLAEELPDWQTAIYYVDLPENVTSPTGLRTRMNKAREAMPYLTYIVDNYPNFPDVVVFMHPHKSGMPQAWHNDARGHNAVYMLQDLKLDTVMERGYVNLRCNNEVGCPEEILPFRDPPLTDKHAEHAYPYVYSAFFNATFAEMQETIPVVATQCCAQFAVSCAELRKRPKEDYEMYKKYLEETEYDDATIGRVMEYMWHVIFGRSAVHCENVFECWCAVYGRCHDLNRGRWAGIWRAENG